MILLDTHAWIWWATSSAKISARAARAIDEEEVVGTSPISCWEIAMLVERRRLVLDREVLAWIRQALALPRAEIVPMSPEIGARAGSLGPDFHGDPADRIIVATALEHRSRLVTKDERIRSFAGVRAIW